MRKIQADPSIRAPVRARMASFYMNGRGAGKRIIIGGLAKE